MAGTLERRWNDALKELQAAQERYESQLADRPWQQVRQDVEVKLLPRDGELYVLAQSRDRMAKERAIHRRKLK